METSHIVIVIALLGGVLPVLEYSQVKQLMVYVIEKEKAKY